eukprot:CAMPEP_0206182936 /NCGR_PEP_ID=MMETSP0166-20121206/348_1 /ASSEMBLY_ACC=CAM_ASM_000260 /TAXON_ID=95228 /ORGANISM="Vannella robusta, Strain DIVA3 518/3/11/1/6" /LENGTH=107 /DNA_ID=CAMNT_0053597713 /DNA_START=1 /DNA_END=324 /DNA_ORIENTATION=+
MQHNKVKHQTDGRIQLNERAKRRDQLTVQELKSLPQSARTYASVGRMFMLAPKEEVNSNINTRLQRIEKELGSLYQQKEFTDKKIKEAEDAVKELMIMNAVKGQKKQ